MVLVAPSVRGAARQLLVKVNVLPRRCEIRWPGRRWGGEEGGETATPGRNLGASLDASQRLQAPAPPNWNGLPMVFRADGRDYHISVNGVKAFLRFFASFSAYALIALWSSGCAHSSRRDWPDSVRRWRSEALRSAGVLALIFIQPNVFARTLCNTGATMALALIHSLCTLLRPWILCTRSEHSV